MMVFCGIQDGVDLYTFESVFAFLHTHSLVQWWHDQTIYMMHKLVYAKGCDRLKLD
jgi:hypothetical protein